MGRLRDEHDVHFPDLLQAHINDPAVVTSTALDVSTFERAHAEGYALDIDGIVRLVRAEVGRSPDQP